MTDEMKKIFLAMIDREIKWLEESEAKGIECLTDKENKMYHVGWRRGLIDIRDAVKEGWTA